MLVLLSSDVVHGVRQPAAVHLVEGRWVDEQFENQDNRDKLSSYVVIKASLSRALPFANGEVFIAAENLLNREYPVDMGGGI